MNNSETVIRGIHYQKKKPIEVFIDKGKIKQINEISGLNKPEAVITPGLIDLQVNGFMGKDFNKNALHNNEWKEVIHELAKVGVTTFYPTIITNSVQHLETIFEENVTQLSSDNINADLIGGFHLEGPYISREDGPRGAHFKEYVKHPDWNEFSRIQERAQGMIKVVTLSPEWDDSRDFVEKASSSGVKVTIGHTAASTNQIHEAVRAGAVLSTHLGNGAHLSLPRHPNYIWDQLAEDSLWASVISDGNHLPANVLKVINKVKHEKMILISDSVALAGMEPGNYRQAVGGEVTLTKNGRLHLKDHYNLLAGSAQYLLQGVQNLVKYQISHFEEAINKASIYPAKLMDLPQKNGLEVGAPADIILLQTDTPEFEVLETYKNGECIYKKGSER